MKNIIKQINKSKRVAIIAHISPDGDCLSSMTALYCILKNLGKYVKRFVDSSKINQMNKDFYELDDTINEDLNVEEFDTIITVDLPSLNQMGKYANAVQSFENTIAIDHHPVRDYKAKYEYIDSSSSSCAEIMFDLFNLMKAKITPQLASVLFSGIITDTNCFQNDNTSKRTFENASKLTSLGAQKDEIIFKFFKQQTIQEVQIKAIGFQNMVIENQIAYTIFTKKHFNQIGDDNCSGVVNDLLNINDTLFAFVIKQKEKNVYSVSLRCKKGYDVSKIAKMFGGGGHIQASGLSFLNAPVRHAKQIYAECLKQIKEKQK